MLNRILILTLLMLVLVGGTAMADKDGDDGTTQRIVVRVAEAGEAAAEATEADAARKAYAIAVEELQAAPVVSAWAVGEGLSEMLLVDQSKLKQAHEKLLEAMARLHESNDLSAEGMQKLQALLDELAADLESTPEWSAVGEAHGIAAPSIDMRDGEQHKVIIRKLMGEGETAPVQLKIMIDGDEVQVEGEGLSDEELADIERKIAEGEHNVIIGATPLMPDGPLPELRGITSDELGMMLEKEHKLDLELKLLDEKLGELNLSELELRPLEAPMADNAHGIYMELAPELHAIHEDEWHKEWQALEEELQQVLSAEQLAKLHKLMQQRSWATPHVPGHVFEFFGQDDSEFPATDWNEHHDIFRNYAPDATPFFEWRTQELGEDWEAEVEQLMGEIEQMMKELMLRYQEQH